jgi:hypothetical protein
MAGVSLVGFSGSLIKDFVKDTFTLNFVPGLTKSELPPTEPIDSPEATTVLVGKLLHPIHCF